MRVVSRLLVHGVAAVVVAAAVVQAQAPNGAPVAAAASRGDLAAVRELIKQGADAGAAQGDGMTALHWAASRGDAAMVEMLTRAGANVGAGTRIGHYQPIHLASRNGSAATVRALLKAGASAMARTDTSGVTPLVKPHFSLRITS